MDVSFPVLLKVFDIQVIDLYNVLLTMPPAPSPKRLVGLRGRLNHNRVFSDLSVRASICIAEHEQLVAQWRFTSHDLFIITAFASCNVLEHRTEGQERNERNARGHDSMCESS